MTTTDGRWPIDEESSEKEHCRGRPRTWPKTQESAIKFLMPEIRTERGVLEHRLMTNALHCVMGARKANPDGTAWVDYYTDGPHILHKSILAAIGRLRDEASILEWAKTIAENKIPTDQAVAAIREARIGRGAEPRALVLLMRICRAIGSYQRAHPSSPKEMIVNVLRDVADDIADEEEG
jgi:hypothetical protein